MPVILDLSLSGLATAGKAALVVVAMVGSFKLFAKQHPKLLSATDEKGTILAGTCLTTFVSGMYTLCQATDTAQSITPVVAIFSAGLLTSCAIDRVCERQ
ncbi:MAG: hypothetical protein Homavirus24_7 [Homavirus sp.]|uniref:Uncharacterized protein n=1 Tax=Homavirus sp. TaxID=2487769 RepID=A0A3G5A711_9VIRU|nr:MAG: hypothetical protein Homavirus24_7 [Homavirus sp.]